MSTFKDVPVSRWRSSSPTALRGTWITKTTVMLEEAQRQMLPSASTECWPTNNSLPGNSAARVRHMRGDPQSDDLSEPAFGPPPEAIALCPPAID